MTEDLISNTTAQVPAQSTAKSKTTEAAAPAVKAVQAQKKLEFPRKIVLKNNTTVVLTEPETGTLVYPAESVSVFVISADVLTRAKTNIAQMDLLLDIKEGSCMSFEEEEA